MRILSRALLAVGAAVVVATALPDGTATAADLIETTYDRPGPYTTTTSTITDSGGLEFEIHRPADYGPLGFASPILSWGNGSDATPSNYSTMLNHLASYGFTVIASTLTNTGSGNAIDAGTRYLIAQNSAADSPYLGRLDTGRIGVFGHSQGATGAVNAAIHNQGRYATVLTFSMPDQKWAAPNPDCPTADDCRTHPDQLQVPTFLISTHGSVDAVIAPPETEIAYFQSIPGRAVLGLVDKGCDHSSLQDNGDPHAELGYATAWLLSQLRGDSTAAKAFDGTNSEIVGNSDWPGSLVK